VRRMGRWGPCIGVSGADGFCAWVPCQLLNVGRQYKFPTGTLDRPGGLVHRQHSSAIIADQVDTAQR
jgi:hypothetical protein